MTETSLKDKRPSKLSVIGAGAVGSSLAYAALIRGSAREVALYDLAEAKVNAEVADLQHGTQFTATNRVMGGADIAVVEGSSVIMITAGAKQRPGQTRLDLAATNAGILTKLMPQLLEHAPDAIYVLVTNPCDVLTVVAQKVSGLSTGRVFSTGTMLDTSRLRWAIARHSGIHQTNVHATIVGEHGDTEFPLWSTARIGDIPILDWVDETGATVFTPDLLDDLAHEAVHAAYAIIEGKGATNFAIGLTGARLTEVLHSPVRRLLPLSSVLTDYKGVSGVALSAPSVVSNQGLERVLDMPMDDAEVAKFRHSAETLRASLKSLGF